MGEIISNEEIKENTTLENEKKLKSNPHHKNLVLAQNLLRLLHKRRIILQVEINDINYYEYGFEEPLLCLEVIIETLTENDKVLKSISSFWLNTELNNSGRKIVKLPNILDSSFKKEMKDLESNLAQIIDYMGALNDLERAVEISDESFANFRKLKENLSESNILLDDLRSKTIKELYDEDYRKFSKISRSYEVGFYILIVIMFLYFLGFNLSVKDIDFGYFSLIFPERKNTDNIPFYIQKVSMLVLSTTLAAFLLKKSFMNRRLADESFRTSKELAGLPRFIEPLSIELQEKIRFDLAYKYFGNSIYHESYTGGENLMHESIRANTDFIKALKDLKMPDSGKADLEGK
ncbi:hypothetical protein RMA95_05565 [Acinetobacter sp. V110_1]|uniref:hypothetical protein n=1 Tax=Acinetobacter sp. V110_1 TaxID=3072988 RepID=UPI00287E031A|nr:hypothetical protein [Acinetobacter sp. V110_1]MDS7943374.1 hypothetical protein [Acinetobacter sp. V110_1]